MLELFCETGGMCGGSEVAIGAMARAVYNREVLVCQLRPSGMQELVKAFFQ